MAKFDPTQLLGLLVDGQVDFVVIGGMAATIHGAELPTLNLDIMYEPSRGNLKRLAKVLQALDVRLRGAEDVRIRVDAAYLRNGDSFTLVTPYGDFDCLGSVDGAGSFAEVKQKAEWHTIGGRSVAFASLDDLIAMKRTTGRRKDIPKLAELEELRKLVE